MSPFVVGIAGGSGSGKTTLIRMLRSELGSNLVTVISQDDYYLDKEHQTCDENGHLNFDLPNAIDHTKLLKDLDRVLDGQTVEINRYTFNNLNDLTEKLVLDPRPVVIVEGLFVFHYAGLRERFQYKIFVDAEAETRFNRRIVRDMSERGYPEEVVRYQWEHHVEPAFRRYLLPYRDNVDVIIDNEFEMRRELNEVIKNIKVEVAALAP